MKGIAAPNPLRRHGLPGDALAAAALAARDGGSNAGSPGVASAGSPAPSDRRRRATRRRTTLWPSPGACGALGVTDFPDPDPHGGPGG